MQVVPLKIRIPEDLAMTDEFFYEFCRANPALRVERSPQGEIIVISPTGGETGSRNSKLIMLLNVWSSQSGTGVVFDSSTGFILLSGAIRSPDASWVRRGRLAKLTAEQKRGFLPLCPDFVVELRAPTDRLLDLQEKMVEYIENGAQLGWLIDPAARTVYEYRPDSTPAALLDPATVSGDPVLSGFLLDLSQLWDAGF
ncbi:MAG: Uma2 family endonuclease [Caldilineaceae bacterium]|nr:Uma2 family endonuclease [Caldilineaceae bacterium]